MGNGRRTRVTGVSLPNDIGSEGADSSNGHVVNGVGGELGHICGGCGGREKEGQDVCEEIAERHLSEITRFLPARRHQRVVLYSSSLCRALFGLESLCACLLLSRSTDPIPVLHVRALEYFPDTQARALPSGRPIHAPAGIRQTGRRVPRLRIHTRSRADRDVFPGQ